MSKIRVESKCALYDGMSLTFKAPCDSNAVDGLNVYYAGVVQSFTFRDALKNDLAGVDNLFKTGTYVKVVLDTTSGYAYLQNADSNGYLEQKFGEILSDDTKALYGFGSDAVPDNVLAGLALLCGAGEPTNKTVGVVGQCYFDTATEKFYKCVSLVAGESDVLYIWVAMNSGNEAAFGTRGPVVLRKSQTFYLKDYGLKIGDKINVVVIGGGGGGGTTSGEYGRGGDGGKGGVAATSGANYQSQGGGGGGGGGYGAGGGGAGGPYRSSNFPPTGGAGGGSGYITTATITLDSDSIPVTIGAAGLGSDTAGVSGTAGGTTSFGSYLSAAGGAGGQSSTGSGSTKGGAGGHAGGAGGMGTGNSSMGKYPATGGGGGGGWRVVSMMSYDGSDGEPGLASSTDSTFIGGTGGSNGGVGGGKGQSGQDGDLGGEGAVIVWY